MACICVSSVVFFRSSFSSNFVLHTQFFTDTFISSEISPHATFYPSQKCYGLIMELLLFTVLVISVVYQYKICEEKKTC